MNRSWRNHEAHHGERGVTMIFVALYNSGIFRRWPG